MATVRELITVLGFSVNKKPLDDYVNSIDQVPTRVDAVARKVRNAFAGIFAGFTALEFGKQFIAAGDEMLMTIAKLQGAMGDARDRAGEFYERFYQFGRETGVAVKETADGFGRFAMVSRELKKPLEEAADLAEGLQRAFILNGKSAQESSAIVLQLGQALGKGTFNDDEFKSFMENGGQLVEDFRRALVGAIPGYDGSTKKLRELSTAGKLTSDIVWPAMIRALRRTNDEFSKLPVTASRAGSILKITFTRFLADINLAIGASTKLGGALIWVSDYIEWLRKSGPAISAFIRDHFSMRSVIEFVGIALGLAFGARFLTMMGYATAATLRFGWAMMRAAFIPTLIAAGFVLLALAIQDVISYFQGKDSFTGLLVKWLGDTDFGKGFTDAFEVIKAAAKGFGEAVEAVWEAIKRSIESAGKSLEDYFGTPITKIKEMLPELGGSWMYWVGVMVASLIPLGGALLGIVASLKFIRGFASVFGLGAAAATAAGGAAAAGATGAAATAANAARAGAVAAPVAVAPPIPAGTNLGSIQPHMGQRQGPSTPLPAGFLSDSAKRSLWASLRLGAGAALNAGMLGLNLDWAFSTARANQQENDPTGELRANQERQLGRRGANPGRLLAQYMENTGAFMPGVAPSAPANVNDNRSANLETNNNFTFNITVPPELDAMAQAVKDRLMGAIVDPLRRRDEEARDFLRAAPRVEAPAQ